MTHDPSRPRGPGQPGHDPDDIEELGDDAILAQQSAAHAPPTRVQVQMEARSVVVSDLPPEVDPSEVMKTRQLQPLPGSRDPTMVLPRARFAQPAPPKSTTWVTVAIWVVAGVLAFAFGGLLALLSAKRSAPPAPPPAATAVER